MILVKSRYYEIIDEILDTINLNNKTVIDGTLGNGNDSLKILKKMNNGFLYGFDVQEIAINNSDKLLRKNGFNNYKLILDSHENIDKYIKEDIELAIYNLGYLPRSDKSIVTKPDSTVKSVSKAINKLSETGVVIVVSYIGHPGSYEENYELEKFLKTLDQRKYKVEKREFFNQVHTPPKVYLISRGNE